MESLYIVEGCCHCEYAILLVRGNHFRGIHFGPFMQHSQKSNQSGSAILIVLAVLTALVIIGLPFMLSMRFSIEASRNYLSKTQLDYGLQGVFNWTSLKLYQSHQSRDQSEWDTKEEFQNLDLPKLKQTLAKLSDGRSLNFTVSIQDESAKPNSPYTLKRSKEAATKININTATLESLYTLIPAKQQSHTVLLEWKKVKQNLTDAIDTLKQNHPKHYQQLVDSIDKNENGELEKNEISQFHDLFGEDLTSRWKDSRIAKSFNIVDENGNSEYVVLVGIKGKSPFYVNYLTKKRMHLISDSSNKDVFYQYATITSSPESYKIFLDKLSQHIQEHGHFRTRDEIISLALETAQGHPILDAIKEEFVQVIIDHLDVKSQNIFNFHITTTINDKSGNLLSYTELHRVVSVSPPGTLTHRISSQREFEDQMKKSGSTFISSYPNNLSLKEIDQNTKAEIEKIFDANKVKLRANETLYQKRVALHVEPISFNGNIAIVPPDYIAALKESIRGTGLRIVQSGTHGGFGSSAIVGYKDQFKAWDHKFRGSLEWLQYTSFSKKDLQSIEKLMLIKSNEFTASNLTDFKNAIKFTESLDKKKLLERAVAWPYAFEGKLSPIPSFERDRLKHMGDPYHRRPMLWLLSESTDTFSSEHSHLPELKASDNSAQSYLALAQCLQYHRQDLPDFYPLYTENFTFSTFHNALLDLGPDGVLLGKDHPKYTVDGNLLFSKRSDQVDITPGAFQFYFKTNGPNGEIIDKDFYLFDARGGQTKHDDRFYLRYLDGKLTFGVADPSIQNHRRIVYKTPLLYERWYHVSGIWRSTKIFKFKKNERTVEQNARLQELFRKKTNESSGFSSQENTELQWLLQKSSDGKDTKRWLGGEKKNPYTADFALYLDGHPIGEVTPTDLKKKETPFVIASTAGATIKEDITYNETFISTMSKEEAMQRWESIVQTEKTNAVYPQIKAYKTGKELKRHFNMAEVFSIPTFLRLYNISIKYVHKSKHAILTTSELLFIEQQRYRDGLSTKVPPEKPSDYKMKRWPGSILNNFYFHMKAFFIWQEEIFIKHGFYTVKKADNVINVSSTEGFQTKGFIRIGREYIYYSGKTPSSFTGCQRGMLGTKANDHYEDQPVWMFSIWVNNPDPTFNNYPSLLDLFIGNEFQEMSRFKPKRHQNQYFFIPAFTGFPKDKKDREFFSKKISNQNGKSFYSYYSPFQLWRVPLVAKKGEAVYATINIGIEASVDTSHQIKTRNKEIVNKTREKALINHQTITISKKTTYAKKDVVVISFITMKQNYSTDPFENKLLRIMSFPTDTLPFFLPDKVVFGASGDGNNNDQFEGLIDEIRFFAFKDPSFNDNYFIRNYYIHENEKIDSFHRPNVAKDTYFSREPKVVETYPYLRTVLANSVTPSERKLSAANYSFPISGFLEYEAIGGDREIIGYTDKSDNEFTSKIRGAFGSELLEIKAGKKIQMAAVRYWDRYDKNNLKESPHVQIEHLGYGTNWISIEKDKHLYDPDTQDIRTLIRFNENLDWQNPVHRKTPLGQIHEMKEDQITLGIPSNKIEARFFFRYLPGAYDSPTQSWRTSPELHEVRIQYTQPTIVLESRN